MGAYGPPYADTAGIVAITQRLHVEAVHSPKSGFRTKVRQPQKSRINKATEPGAAKKAS